jgi:hypothetical protein
LTATGVLLSCLELVLKKRTRESKKRGREEGLEGRRKRTLSPLSLLSPFFLIRITDIERDDEKCAFVCDAVVSVCHAERKRTKDQRGDGRRGAHVTFSLSSPSLSFSIFTFFLFTVNTERRPFSLRLQIHRVEKNERKKEGEGGESEHAAVLSTGDDRLP